jgi:peptide/nickel transport system permease protein
VVSAVVLLFLVSVFVFWATSVGPGDAASRIAGPMSSPDQVARIRAELGLDRSVVVRYFEWIRGIVTGDLGNSLTSGRPVSDVLGGRALNTAILAGVAFAVYIPVTLLASVWAVSRRGRLGDHVVNGMTLFALSIPEFVMGTVLLVGFTVYVPILPAVSNIETADSLRDYIEALALPVVILVAVMSAYAIRMLRESLLEVLDSDYIRLAEFKGVSRRGRLWRYALPNSLMPVLTVSALNLAYLIGGIVVVEVVFRYPGLGSLLVESLAYRDTPLVAAAALLGSAVYVIANLAVDLLGMLFVPKLRDV